MPFTPFHLGAGALLKGALDKKISFLVFGGAQVLMDIEPLIGLLQHKPILHGITHTLTGALVIGFLASMIGKPIAQIFLKFWGEKSWRVSWQAAFLGAWLGTFSHIILDAIMHADMQPFLPFSTHNFLLHIISLPNLHYLCLIFGIVGIFLMILRKILQKNKKFKFK